MLFLVPQRIVVIIFILSYHELICCGMGNSHSFISLFYLICLAETKSRLYAVCLNDAPRLRFCCGYFMLFLLNVFFIIIIFLFLLLLFVLHEMLCYLFSTIYNTSTSIVSREL